MKKVLISFPTLKIKNEEGSKHRLICHINEYKRHGYEVDVLAFCKDAVFTCDKRYLTAEANWIIRPMLFPRGKNLFLTKMLMAYLKFVIGIHTWLKRYDVVQMEMFGSRSFLCRKGTKYITDVHGDSVYETKEMHEGKEWFVNYNFKQQKEFVNKSDICIFVSENLKKQLEINTRCKVHDYAIISCGVDIDKFVTARKESFNDLDLSERIVLGYCGAFQKWQNFETMIDLAIRLREKDERVFLLVFSNSRPNENELRKLEELGDNNYLIKGLHPDEVPSHLKLMDAGMLLRSDLVMNKVSSPTKICEYLASGVPLICTLYSGDYQRSVIHGENGFVAHNVEFTDQEISDLMNWLKKVKENRKRIADKCVNSVLNRTFEEEFNALAEKLNY